MVMKQGKHGQGVNR